MFYIVLCFGICSGKDWKNKIKLHRNNTTPRQDGKDNQHHWLARHLGTHVFALFQNSSSHDPRWSLCIPQNVPHRAACAGLSSAHCLKGVWHTPLLIGTAAAMSPNGLLLSHDKDIPYWPYWGHIQTHWLAFECCWLQNHPNIPSLKDLQGSCSEVWHLLVACTNRCIASCQRLPIIYNLDLPNATTTGCWHCSLDFVTQARSV